MRYHGATLDGRADRLICTHKRDYTVYKGGNGVFQ